MRIYEENGNYDPRYHILNQIPEFDVTRIV
jgi:hypothetical protein